MMRVFVLGALVLGLSGCSDDGSSGDGAPVEIASGPLSGKVGGTAWTLTSARTSALLSDEQTFWVDMYGQGSSSCGDFGEGNSLILNVPKKVGTYRLSLALNATFVVDGAETQNLVATQGAIRVDEITETSLRGGVTMTYDAANSVSGGFDATICAE